MPRQALLLLLVLLVLPNATRAQAEETGAARVASGPAAAAPVEDGAGSTASTTADVSRVLGAQHALGVRREAAAPPLADEAEEDRIEYLPGWPHELPSRHYAGYVRVGGSEQGSGAPPARMLFYYLVESERDPTNDPVVLWTNGGPGCASEDAFIYEHGPFLFSEGTGGSGSLPSLSQNPFSWSKAATMIYLDSPANVGLSYVEEDDASSSIGKSVYHTNDTHTAQDAAAFVRALLGERHPRLLSLPFFVTGESYAGIYVPLLARELMRGNKAGKLPRVNLKGYAIGNGCTDAQYDGNALPPFLAGRGLLPQDEYGRLFAACNNGSFWDEGGGGGGESASKSECSKLLHRSARVLDGINIYDVLDLCHASHRHVAPSSLSSSLFSAASSPPTTTPDNPFARALATPPPLPVRPSSYSPRTPRLAHNPPCTSATLAEAWLNDWRVRAALHAAPLERTGPWTLCSDRLRYTRDAGSMLPVHSELLPGLPGWPQMLRRAGMVAEAEAAEARALASRHEPSSLRALIYSGDHDAAVPSTGSEAWTRDIGGGEAVAGRGWRRWMVAGGTDAGGHPATDEDAGDEGEDGGGRSGPRQQVAGFTVDYPGGGGLTYATVRGAGHMVPTSKPLEALEMFRRWVDGEGLAPPEKDEADVAMPTAVF
jgi:serine carboxypeptidase-like clade 1